MDEQLYRFILAEHIKDFLTSRQRKRMIEGLDYYTLENKVEILNHAFVPNLIDEKVSYLAGEPFVFDGEDEDVKAMQDILGEVFQYEVQRLAREASIKGIAWWQAYLNEQGEFKLMRIPSEQVCPLWKDDEHTQLESVMRVYEIETYEGANKDTVTHVEHYEPDGVTYYIYKDGALELDAEKYLKLDDDVKAGHYIKNGKQMVFGEVPYIWCKNNDYEIPDYIYVKTLVDDYNKNRTDVSNLLDDVRNWIMNIVNYGGEATDDILALVKEKRVVRTEDDGKVEILTPTIDIQAAKEHCDQLKKDVDLFGRAIPTAEKLGQAPNEMTIKSLYSKVDLKCNSLEAELQNAFKRLQYFIGVYLNESRKSLYSVATIIFNRDIAVNESAAIADCQKSMGVISQKTIVKNHPWVTDTDEELKQIESEQPIVSDYEGLPQEVMDNEQE